MGTQGFERLKTLVFAAPERFRDGIISALGSEGFKDVLAAGSVGEFVERLNSGHLDLVIAITRLDGVFVGSVLRDLRLGLVGTSPFPVVLAILLSPDQSQVMAALDSGVDDLLVFPMPPEALFKRIRQFTQERRPFVINHDYIGPDRRTSPRGNDSSSSLAIVPNPLRSRFVGVDEATVRQTIDDGAALIDRYKLRQNGFHLLRLLTQMRDLPPSGTGFAPLLEACRTTAEDVIRRCRGVAERGVRDKATLLLETIDGFAATSSGDRAVPDAMRRVETVVDYISVYQGEELRL